MIIEIERGTNMKIEIRTYGYPSEDLAGWDPNLVALHDYESHRAQCLFEALGISSDDEAYHLAAAEDGRWGLFGPSNSGESYAVEIGV
jgi:hypothetical protein